MPDKKDIEIIFRTQDDFLADYIRTHLQEAGIECGIVSDVPHSVLPLTVDGLGEIRLWVQRSAAPEARDLIKILLTEDSPSVPQENN